MILCNYNNIILFNLDIHYLALRSTWELSCVEALLEYQPPNFIQLFEG